MELETSAEVGNPHRRDGRRSFSWLLPLVLWIPGLLAVGYVVLQLSMVTTLRSNYFHWLPDFVWAPILAQDLAQRGYGGLINVGEAAHYSSIWLSMLTQRLPLGRQIEDVSPLLVSVAGVLLMAWAARRVSGAWAGFMTLAIGVSAGPAILATTATTGMRSHTWFAVGATAALLVYFATVSESRGPWAKTALVILAGILAGVTVASDPLYLVSGIAPLAGAAALVWLLVRTDKTRDLAIMALATAALGIGLGTALNAVMHNLGYRKTLIADGYRFVTPDEFLKAAKSLSLDILTLTNGNFFGREVGLSSAMSLGMALLTVGALCLTVVLLKPLPRCEFTQAGQTPRTVYVLFWALVQLATGAAYLLSPIPTAVGQTITTRYIVPIFYAIAALVPVWADRINWRKLAVAGATTVLCLLSINGLRSGPAESGEAIRVLAPRIAAFLQQEGLERGYGSYRLAHPFTYSVDMKQRAYPVFECRPPSKDLCPFPVNTRSIWYQPEAGKRTFLITDAGAGFLALSSPPSAGLGTPMLVREFGSLVVFVYDYDIASRFVSPSPPA